MNKKTIIQIVIIVGAFAASGMVLYNGLFKNSTPDLSLSASDGAAGAGSNEKILPYGDKLDFKTVLEKQNLQFDIVDYPKLDPQAEVGVDLGNLITSPKSNVSELTATKK
jgi:hypothetical protein